MPLVLFASVSFGIGLQIDVWAELDHDPPIYVNHVAGITGMYHCTQLLLIEMGFLEHFALTGLKLISVS
jgi:hypothetical protein